jgi:hypothetical protein
MHVTPEAREAASMALHVQSGGTEKVFGVLAHYETA